MPALQQNSAREIVERYGSRDDLMRAFHIGEQTLHASHALRCIMGKAPRLEAVNEAYGNGTAEEWLMIQMVDLCEFVGARDKLSPFQVKSFCRLFIKEYGWLKLTDVELFMHRLKTGEYGCFYGSVDPQQVMQRVPEFLRDRNLILDDYYQEEERRRREESFQNAVTWQEFHAMHPEQPDPFEELARRLTPFKNNKH